jgi:acid phosphatase
MKPVETDFVIAMASYELNARPYSDWINVFTLDEWVTFGYTEDLNYYYCAGYDAALHEGYYVANTCRQARG